MKVKKNLLVAIVLATAVSMAAEPVRTKVAEPELAGLVSIAPYADVSAKVTSFGLLIGNPVVPALLLASLQQSAVVTYGRFRSDVPVYLASYMVESGKNDEVVVYPSVDRIARMALAHPGSERLGKDVLHIVPSEKSPHDRYAVFEDVFTAFASSEALARRALADSKPSAKEKLPLVRVALRELGVRSVCQAARKSGATNVADVVQGMSRLDLTLDLDDQGLALVFSGVCVGGMADPVFKKRLESELHGIFDVIGGGDSKLCPSVTVEIKGGGVVIGDVRITKEQLKGLGKDFNSFVTKQMSGALSGEDKGKNTKKGANSKERRK